METPIDVLLDLGVVVTGHPLNVTIGEQIVSFFAWRTLWSLDFIFFHFNICSFFTLTLFLSLLGGFLCLVFAWILVRQFKILFATLIIPIDSN